MVAIISVVYSFVAFSDLTCHLEDIGICFLAALCHLIVMISNSWQAHHPSKEGPGKMKKSCKRGDPEHFSCLLRGWQEVLGPFLVGAVLPLPVMKLGSSKLEVSPTGGKNNTGVVLVSYHACKWGYTAYSGGANISEVPGCHLLW